MKITCGKCGTSVSIDGADENTKFTCRNCAPPDTTNANLHFQDKAFDKKLGGRVLPLRSGGSKVVTTAPKIDPSDFGE